MKSLLLAAILATFYSKGTEAALPKLYSIVSDKCIVNNKVAPKRQFGTHDEKFGLGCWNTPTSYGITYIYGKEGKFHRRARVSSVCKKIRIENVHKEWIPSTPPPLDADYIWDFNMTPVQWRLLKTQGCNGNPTHPDLRTNPILHHIVTEDTCQIDGLKVKAGSYATHHKRFAFYCFYGPGPRDYTQEAVLSTLAGPVKVKTDLSKCSKLFSFAMGSGTLRETGTPDANKDQLIVLKPGSVAWEDIKSVGCTGDEAESSGDLRK